MFVFFPGVDFDWVWDDQGKVKSCVQLSRNKAEVRFHSNYSLGTASARSSEPLTEGQNYWEIKMVSPVYGTDMVSKLYHGRDRNTVSFVCLWYVGGIKNFLNFMKFIN